MLTKEIYASYIRSFVFGVEDSLVSTVGLLSGIAMADVPRQTIFLTGIVLVFVEAFSMAVGSFLSEQSAEGYLRHGQAPFRRSFVTGTVMFCSYFVSGFIPLFPYGIFDVGTAFWLSVVLSLASLFVLGMVGGKFSNISLARNGLKMLIMGGIAILAGMIVGRFIRVSY